MAKEAEVLSESGFQMLRRMDRALIGLGARLDAMDENIAGIRQEIHGLRGQFEALREDVRSAVRQQHAILANNSVPRRRLPDGRSVR